jgi:uncharacterized membrane protein
VVEYANLVVAAPSADLDSHVQFRVLVPYLARPIYKMAEGRSGTWDPIMLGLLVVDSLFVAGTVTLLLMVVAGQIGNYAVALGSALIYLLNFAVPNLRLAGFIDAGEGFFLMLAVWALWRERYWLLPLMGAVGATAKESFVPFLMAISFAWWLSARKKLRRPWSAAAWMVASWVVGLGSLTILQWKITGVYRSPWQFGVGLHGNTEYAAHFLASFRDRNLWYIFFWLFPLSVVRLRRLSWSWRAATAAATVAAFAMDAYYGGAPGTIGRALFSVAGPLLSASVAILLFSGGGAYLGTEAHGAGQADLRLSRPVARQTSG